MSGRKQHYIPQMLLRGFSSAGIGKKRKVFVYKKGRSPFSVPTDGIAAEREFYSSLGNDANESLDDTITRYEQEKLSVALSTMRSTANGASIDRDLASEAVNHLTIRNAQFRNFAGHAMARTLSNFADSMATQAEARSLLGLAGPEVGLHVREAVEELWKKHERELRERGFKEEGFVEFAADLAKAEFPQIYPNLLSMVSSIVNAVAPSIPQVAARGHRKALMQGLAPQIRTSKLKEFEWQVRDIPNLILSDCIAIAYSKDDWLPLTLVGTEGVESILFPVNSQRAVIGFRSVPDVPIDPRKELARCAWDFIIAPGNSNELENLSATIGSVAFDIIEKISATSMHEANNRDGKRNKN